MKISKELEQAVRNYLFHLTARPIVTKKTHQIKNAVLAAGIYTYSSEWQPEYMGRVVDYYTDWMMDQDSFNRYLSDIHAAYLEAGFVVEFDRSPESMVDNSFVDSMKAVIDAAADLLSGMVGDNITAASFRVTPQLMESYANAIVDLVVSETGLDKAAMKAQALAGEYSGFPLS